MIVFFFTFNDDRENLSQAFQRVQSSDPAALFAFRCLGLCCFTLGERGVGDLSGIITMYIETTGKML